MSYYIAAFVFIWWLGHADGSNRRKRAQRKVWQAQHEEYLRSEYHLSGRG